MYAQRYLEQTPGNREPRLKAASLFARSPKQGEMKRKKKKKKKETHPYRFNSYM
ncbi:hypothetical protein N7G274_001066 [Stereocaulon virgatum]|uniref:Uncharacterized protein n=1 Tax=Stereocaulon virgatum TaxID=373712 RepID=A0ABR4AUA4_9LECA